MSKFEEITDAVKDKVPELIKDNKGALIGAIIGLFISDNEKAKSAVLTAIAGSVIVDKKKEEE